MTAHAYHNGLPGFDKRQVLKDGCEECERRGARPWLALNQMDTGRFVAAWRRATEWENVVDEVAADGLNIAKAEVELLRTLSAVQYQLRGVGGLKPGQLPQRIIYSKEGE